MVLATRWTREAPRDMTALWWTRPMAGESKSGAENYGILNFSQAAGHRLGERDTNKNMHILPIKN